MLQRHLKEVLWVCSLVCIMASGCEKDRKTLQEGDELGASSDPIVIDGKTLDPITPENHVPPSTFLVQSYDIEGIGISPPLETGSTESGAGLFEQVGDFRLADGQTEDIYYVSHPITVSANVRVEGGSAAMVLTFGLMEQPAANASVADRANLHSCTLGNVEIRHSGDPESPTQSFSGQFRIPALCLKPGTDRGAYHLWVASDIEGAVKTVGAEKSKPKIIVYDAETIAANSICLQTRKDGPCVNAIQVERSPGINAKLKLMKSNSSVATFDPNFVDGESTDVALLTVNSEAVLEGLADDDQTAADYQFTVTHDICATRSSITDGTDPSCGRSSTEWMPLQMEDPESTEGQRLLVDSQSVKKLRAGVPVSFSSTLYARGDTFTKLKAADGWGKERSFLIRECIKPYKGGSVVEQKNVTAQASNPDATVDDCRMVAVLMADVRAKPTPTARPVCVDASGNPGEASFTLAADCVPVSQLNNPSALNLAADTAPSNVKMFDLGFQKNSLWGKAGVLELDFPTRLNATAGLGGAVFEASKRGDLVGFWGRYNFVTQTTTAKVPYSGNGLKTTTLSLFDVLLYTDNQTIGETYSWSWTPTNLTPPKKKKGVKKAKKYDRATQTFSSASGSLDGPVAIAVKETCKEKSVPVYIIRLGLEICAEAGIYLDAGVKMRNTTNPTTDELADMPNVSKLGLVDGWFMPAAAANVKAAVYLDAYFARAGIEGNVTIIQVGYPITGHLRWGTIANSRYVQVKAYTKVSWDISWLSGSIDLFADLRSVAWCSAWFVSYPCGFTWSRLASYNIYDFRGGGANYELFRYDLKNTLIEL